MERIGPYEPLEELGRGGMGVVLRARCARTGRDVALKLLQAAGASDADVARFEREVQALVRLRHPAIVAVLDAGLSPRGPWVAMELVEGESLLARVRRDGPLEPAEATAIAWTVAGALEHAHAMGVLHRDVKPANVLLARDGRVVLVDFGLARVLGSEARLTLTGEVLGTPCYMAPEQADSRPCGPPADVYGLGATLYEALTGTPPFRGRSLVELLHQVLSVTPARPAGLPPALGELVMRCLEKDAARRPQRAADVASALERGGLDAPARRRRPVLVAAVALLGVALAGASVAQARRAAGALVDAAREAGRPDASSLVMRSRAQLVQRDAPGALTSADAALALEPESVVALCQRANALAVLGRRREALADCGRLAAVGEVSVRLLADAAFIAWLCEDAALAVTLRRRVAQLDPTYRDEHILVMALVKTGQLDEALTVAARVLEDGRLDPGNAAYMLGYLVDAAAPRARALVARACARWPDHEQTLLLNALLLVRTGELEAANAAWSLMLDRSPDHLQARGARARARLQLHDFNGATEDAEWAVRLAPEDPKQWELLVVVREHQRDHAGAEAALTRMIELRPGFGELHLRRAEARSRSGDPAGALADLELATELRPDHGRIWLNLSVARRKARDLRGALEAAEQAVTLAPARFEPFAVRGQAHEELGLRAEARRDYARALELATGQKDKDDMRGALERVSQ